LHEFSLDRIGFKLKWLAAERAQPVARRRISPLDAPVQYKSRSPARRALNTPSELSSINQAQQLRGLLLRQPPGLPTLICLLKSHLPNLL